MSIPSGKKGRRENGTRTSIKRQFRAARALRRRQRGKTFKTHKRIDD